MRRVGVTDRRNLCVIIFASLRLRVRSLFECHVDGDTTVFPLWPQDRWHALIAPG